MFITNTVDQYIIH